MANTIAQLLVELGVNTAAFKEGLDKATYQAKQFAGELKQSFSTLGESVAGLGEAFGGLAPGMGQALTGIKDALEPLIEGFGSAGGAVAGITVAFAAAGIAAIGVAISFSETAARLEDLSHSTGIAVESLSALGLIAATKGIDIETMSKALERMDRSALAAAQAGPKAKNAFTDLGISVTDAEGRMRDAQAIFDDVAAKFATMPDGPEKTAEAMKIFGRAGANLIPLLDEGGAHIAEMREHVEKLNAVISGPTAEASKQLKENMALIGAAFEGVQNQITSDLVPALNVVAKSFVEFFEQNQDGIKSFIDGVAEVAKVVLNVFQEVGLIFSLLYRVFYTAVDELQVLGGTLGKILGDVAAGKFGSIWQDVKDGSKQAASELKYNFNEALDSIAKTGANMAGVVNAKLPAAEKANKDKGEKVQGKDVNLDFIDKEVDALARQAQHEQDLAEAQGKVTVTTIDAKAAAEARMAIQKLQDEAEQKGIANTDKFREKLAAAVEQIKESTKWTAVFQAAIASQTAFDKFDSKITEQIASLEGESVAMTAAQREFAKTDATLTPLRNNLDGLTKEWQELALTDGADPKRLAALADAIRRQSDELEKETANVKKLDAAWQGAEFTKELEKINQQTDALNIENAALLAGNPYGKMEADLEKFIKTMQLAPAQAEALRKALAGQEASQAQAGALNAAKGQGYDPAKVAQLRQEAAALKDLNLPAEEYERTLAKINADIDSQLAKTGGWQSGVKAAFSNFTANIQTEGQVMEQVVGTALKGISDNLASVVSGGKAKWADLVNSMENMLLKSAINNILNSLFKSIGGALSGQGGILGGIGSLFSGGHALGGSVVPGNDYLVGENGPEVMRVDQPSTVYPTGHGPSGKGQTINQQFNISTPNADSFQRSQKQISAQMYRDAAYAHGRTRG